MVLARRGFNPSPARPPPDNVVLIDAIGTRVIGASGTSINYSGLTVGAAATGLAVILCMQATTTPATIVAHWDTAGTNQAMLRVGTQGGGGSADQVVLFGLVSPTPGNKVLGITWTNAAVPDIIALSFTGVHIAGGAAGAFTNFIGSNLGATAQSLSVTAGGAPNDMVLAGIIGGSNSFSAPGGTSLFNDTNFTGTTSAAGQYVAPAASPAVMTWTAATASFASAFAGMEVVPGP